MSVSPTIPDLNPPILLVNGGTIYFSRTDKLVDWTIEPCRMEVPLEGDEPDQPIIVEPKS